MAEERQPSHIKEGADLDDEQPAAKPASAEDRKAAAALSSLDVRGEDVEKEQNKKDVDQNALAGAMSRLDAGGGKAEATAEKKGEEPKKKVKVDPADVALLVDELELTKVKATELLKAHEGDAVRAMTAFVTPVT